jgi:uncharacterized protein YpiB (UPF0302 family)
VEESQYAPKAMKMSTKCVDEVPFRFFKESMMTTDAEKAFHDIRLNKEQHIYLTLNFSDKQKCMQWVAVLEDNPFYKPKPKKEDETAVDNLLDNILFDCKLASLDAEIDKALETGDKGKFTALAIRRENLLRSKPEKLYGTVKR